MSIDRRDFLSASLGAGALLAAPPGLAAVRPDARLVLLRSAGDAEFAAAVRAAWSSLGLGPAEELALTDALTFDPAALAAALADRRGARLVALTDDCAHTLVEAAVCDAGGAVLCRGTHVAAAGSSRHRFASLPASQGIGGAFAAALDVGHRVRELALDPVADAGGTALAPAPWPVLLGTALALVAAGRWRAGSVSDGTMAKGETGAARRVSASLVAAI